MSAQVAADLRAAADVLERDGWTQGDYAVQVLDGPGDRPCRCVLGALLTVAHPEAVHPAEVPPVVIRDRFDPAVDELVQHLGFSYGLHVVDWNDAPGRTAAEVIAALRAAADRAEADQ